MNMSTHTIASRHAKTSGTESHADQRRESRFESRLVYDEYFPEFGVFRHRDGSLGAIYEAVPIPIGSQRDALTVGEIESMTQAMRSWFSLPTDCTLQILYQYDPRDQPDQAKDLETSGQARTIVSVRWFPGGLPRGSQELATHATRPQEARRSNAWKEMKKFSRLASRFQHCSKVPLKRLTAVDLIDELRAFFNPKTHPRYRFTPYDPNVSISDQIIFHQPLASDLGMAREGVMTGAIVLESAPKYLFPGGLRFSFTPPFAMRLCLDFSFPVKHDLKRAEQELMHPWSDEAPDDRSLNLVLCAIVEGEGEEELRARTDEAVRFFEDEFACKTDSEPDHVLDLCLNSLPCGHGLSADTGTYRSLRMTRTQAVPFTPIFETCPELSDALGLTISQSCGLSPISSKRLRHGEHVAIISDHDLDQNNFLSGTYRAARYLGLDPVVFRLMGRPGDATGVEDLDQSHFVFDPSKEMPIRPFSGVFDKSKVDFVTRFLTAGITLTSPAFEVRTEHYSALSAAIRKASAKHADQTSLTIEAGRVLKSQTPPEASLSVQDVIKELATLPTGFFQEHTNETIEMLMQKLMPFYGNGIYAKYFDHAPDDRRLEHRPAYVFDLHALESRSPLMILSLMAVTEEIRCIMSKELNHGRIGCVLLENMTLPGGNHAATQQALTELLNAAKSLGLWTASVMPKVEDYFERQSGWTLWGEAEHLFLLPVRSGTVTYLARIDRFSDETLERIRSLKTKLGEHFDVHYINRKKDESNTFRFFEAPPGLARHYPWTGQHTTHGRRRSHS